VLVAFDLANPVVKSFRIQLQNSSRSYADWGQKQRLERLTMKLRYVVLFCGMLLIPAAAGVLMYLIGLPFLAVGVGGLAGAAAGFALGLWMHRRRLFVSEGLPNPFFGWPAGGGLIAALAGFNLMYLIGYRYLAVVVYALAGGAAFWGIGTWAIRRRQ